MRWQSAAWHRNPVLWNRRGWAQPEGPFAAEKPKICFILRMAVLISLHSPLVPAHLLESRRGGVQPAPTQHSLGAK